MAEAEVSSPLDLTTATHAGHRASNRPSRGKDARRDPQALHLDDQSRTEAQEVFASHERIFHGNARDESGVRDGRAVAGPAGGLRYRKQTAKRESYHLTGSATSPRVPM